jgi:hypothetical protein
MAVITDANQEIIVTGFAYNSNNYDYLTIKYSAYGDTVWSRRYDGGLTDLADDVAIDCDNNIIVTGSSYGSFDTTAYLTIKYNPVGDTLWIKSFVSPSYVYNQSEGVATDFNNNVIVTGNASSWPRIIKYTPLGDTLWTLNFPTYSGLEESKDVAVDTVGNIYIIANCNKFFMYDYDYFIAKISPVGDTVWTVLFREAIDDYDEYPYGVAVNLAGDLIVTGIEFNGTDFDYLTVKYSQGSFIEEDRVASSTITKFKVYPNPFRSKLMMEFIGNSEEVVNIRIYDVNGRMIRNLSEKNVAKSNEIIIWDDMDKCKLSAGIYFVKIETSIKSEIQKIIKLR